MGFTEDQFSKADYIYVPYIPLVTTGVPATSPIVVIKTYGDDEYRAEENENPDILSPLRKKYGRRLNIAWMAEQEEERTRIFLASQPSITDTGMSPRKRVMSV